MTRLEISDKRIGELKGLLKKDDIMVIMADHGNDPLIGHSKHTREEVPLLVYWQGHTGKHLGIRQALSDIEASVCDYFQTGMPENGKSFLERL